MRSFDAVREAEEENLSRFEGDLLREEAQIYQAMKTMKDGEAITVETNPKYVENHKDEIGLPYWENEINEIFSVSDLKLMSGITNLKSFGRFTIRRLGNVISIEGSVDHFWSDRYDFEKDEKFPLDFSYTPLIDSDNMKELEDAQLAKPYDASSSWRHHVTGTISIQNGELSNPHVVWTRLPDD